MDDGDPVMEMYKSKAIVIEKEAEMDELRKRIEELERERLGRNQVWTAISKLEDSLKESNALLQQRVEQSERTLKEAMSRIETQKLEETEIIKIIHDRVTALEETDKFDRIERRLEEIAARFERNEVENVQKGMEELKAANSNLLERKTTVEDRIKGNETILIMGGQRDDDWLDEMVILDRKTSTWKVLKLKLPCKNSSGGSALLNGEIYIFGGWGLEKKLYKLDSQQMRWIQLAEMNEGGQKGISNSSLVFQGCIWVFGGSHVFALDTVEKYCPERNEWIKMPGMSQQRNLAAAAVCNEKIFVSGGYDERIIIQRTLKSLMSQRTLKKSYLKSVECFDPASRVWTPMVDMPGDRYGHSMISDGSSLFVLGGWDGNIIFKTVWRIRPSEENAIWEELQPMNELRSRFTAKSLCCSTPGYKKEIFAIGGLNDMKSLDSVEIFDGERWRDGPKLPNGCYSMSSVVIPSSLAETLLQC